eukprot:TRINITY_DN4889_c0_g1_i1.p1 TRINITY_DN4889_c0_g1~~TRINITY_DN4889_c0_g1_i1.p1  ORF type:complete len:328 (-),score=87.64 TRINITY_DN4889_c0_g1_i1:360-1343(-)
MLPEMRADGNSSPDELSEQETAAAALGANIIRPPYDMNAKVFGASSAPGMELQDAHLPSLPASSKGQKGNLLWREERRERRRRLKQERMNERQKRAGVVLCVASAFDVFISGFMMCVAFAHGYLDNGVSLYCLGLQALSHALSSLLLFLRFWDEHAQPQETTDEDLDAGLLRDRRRSYLVREKVLSFAMGGVMLLSSLALAVKAIRKICYWDVWYKDHLGMDHDAEFATVFLAWYGVVVYSGQAFLRFVVGRILKRAVVRYSIAASMVSLGYLFVIGMAALAEDEWSWKAEPVAATVLACVTIVEGSRLIYTHRGSVDLKLDFDSMA